MASAATYSMPGTSVRPLDPEPGLYNDDLAPVPPERRDWTWVNMATVWMGMVHNVVAYETAAGLKAMGLNAWQAPCPARVMACRSAS